MGELTRTHHIKLPLRLINSHHEANFQGKLEFHGLKKHIVGYSRSKWYKHCSSLSNIYGFNDYFYLKKRLAVNINNDFKFKKSNNENQVEINYRNTPNKTNSKLKFKSKNLIASANLRKRFSSLTYCQQNL